MEGEQPKRDYLLPGSILVAALLVSFSVIWSAGKNAPEGSPFAAALGGTNPAAQGGTAQPPSNPAAAARPPAADDHLLGNSKASVVVVVFSDFECSFCKQFHMTMHQALETFPGKVAWVYRHLPLDQLHTKAAKEAEAAECAAELGGNAKFWAYADRLFAVTPSNDRLDLAELPKIAEYVGLDRAKFESCLSSGRQKARVDRDREAAAAAGAQGTPFSVVYKNGTQVGVIPGALPFEGSPGRSVRSILEEALR